MIADELHGTARLHIHLAKIEGHKIDKKLMRFDATVETAMQYGRVGDPFNADIARDALLSECIGVCVIGDRDYTGNPAICYKWMESSQ